MTGKRSSLIKYPKDGVIHCKAMRRHLHLVSFSLFVLSGAHCCVQGEIVHAPLMAFETSTTKNLFVWMEVIVSSLKQ
ncbi:hypothetical protein CMV_018133 [Castanea mollissima]|uniref:Uncharacterized protein n=1 Tax=Castanea mollissima TaxID=60419 RepID=A0A8J4QPW7_9ROSI|nr:hypothetical protein CMV_018133 [Castanea mollissima]